MKHLISQIYPNSANSQLQVGKESIFSYYLEISEDIVRGKQTKSFYAFRNLIFCMKTFEQEFVIRYLKFGLNLSVYFFSLLQELRPFILENMPNRAS